MTRRIQMPSLPELLTLFSIREMNLPPWQEELAVRSPAFLGLMRQARAYPDDGQLVCLTAIWQAAGSPEGVEPQTWTAEPDNRLDGQVIEDRGPDGVWADWDTAGWYCRGVDPENLDAETVCRLLY